MGKVIHWDLCKWLHFDQTDKCYKLKLKSLLENEPSKRLGLLWEKADHPIKIKIQDMIIVNQKKKKIPNIGFCCSETPQSSFQSKQKEKYLEFSKELSKLWNMKITVMPVIMEALGIVSNSLEKRLKEVEKLKPSGDIESN